MMTLVPLPIKRRSEMNATQTTSQSGEDMFLVFTFKGKTYVKITLQAIFDLAWDAFIIKRKAPCLNASGTCAYVNYRGNRCAVGLAIPAGHPALQCEGPFGDLVDKYPELWAADVKSLSRAELTNFQTLLHDGLISGTPAKFPSELRAMVRSYAEAANKYNLKMPERLPEW